MKVALLAPTGRVYSSNVYLVLGEWKRLCDPNVLVDVGADAGLLARLDGMATGVGKRKVEKVIITHNHSDHVAILPLLRELYNPRVLAFSPHVPEVDDVLVDGQRVRAGDCVFEVIHMPGHSDDSVCLYEPTQGLLFTGDSPVIIRSEGGTYEPRFVEVLARLCTLDIRAIYPGHGEPLRGDLGPQLRRSLEIARLGAQPARAGS